MANIKDVAKLANVSISTVSSVINNNKSVSDELRKRIEDAIKELDYQTSPVARSLKNRKSGTIGVILPNIASIFFPELLNGIENTAYKYGYSIIYFNSHQNIDREKKYIEMLANYFVEGIIIDSSVDIDKGSDYIRFLEKIIQKHKIPIISLERTLPNKRIGSVKVDNEYGGYLVTEHLIDMGHKLIAHIAGHMGYPMSLDRISGYRRALQEHGLVYNEDLLIKSGDFSPVSGYNAMKELLKKGLPFTGVFAGNDQEAIGAIKAIKEEGLQIPQDIAVAGFDDISVASLVEPALTSISFSKFELGAMSVESLIQSIRNPDLTPGHEVLDINLTVRRSSDPNSNTSWNLNGW